MAAAVSVNVTQDAIEVLSQPTPDARVSQVIVELLVSTVLLGPPPPVLTASPYGVENIAVGVPGPNPEIV